MPQANKKNIVALLIPRSNDVEESFKSAVLNGFNSICMRSIFKQEYTDLTLDTWGDEEAVAPISWFEACLPNKVWMSNVYALLSDVTNMLEGNNEVMASRARKLLRREMDFARYTSIGCVFIELHASEHYTHMASLVQGYLTSPAKVAIKVKLMFENLAIVSDDHAWSMWNQFRNMCGHSRRLSVGLEITKSLPPKERMLRWIGENVKYIFVPTELCVINSDGVVDLITKEHCSWIQSFIQLGAKVIFQETDQLGDKRPAIHEYPKLVKSLKKSAIPLYDEYFGCKRSLFPMLPPKSEGLISSESRQTTSEKYKLYTIAISAALRSLVPDEEKDTKVVTLVITRVCHVPMTLCCLEAAKQAQRRVKIFAVDEDSNVAATLHHYNKHYWNDLITVLNINMRDWNSENKVHMIISEVLISPSANEQLPEFFDEIQKFLEPGGVMIPQGFYTFVVPVSSVVIHNEVRKLRDQYIEENHLQNDHVRDYFEHPYSVYTQKKYDICELKLAFSFFYPKPDTRIPNERYSAMTFLPKENCMVNGFLCYSSFALYNDVFLTSVPHLSVKQKLTWLPMFFPFSEPITVSKGQNLTVNFWRYRDKINVWHEWGVSSPSCLPVSNPLGRSYKIRLV